MVIQGHFVPHSFHIDLVIFFKDLIFYEIQFKKKGITQSRYAGMLILRLSLIVSLTKVCCPLVNDNVNNVYLMTSL